MDATVSARIPIEVRDRVHALLRQHGSTPTELINRAYMAYLKTGQLPKESEPVKNRVFNEQQKEAFCAFLANSSVPLSDAPADATLADLRKLSLEQRYSQYIDFIQAKPETNGHTGSSGIHTGRKSKEM